MSEMWIGTKVRNTLTSPVVISIVLVLVGWQVVSLFFHPSDFPGLPRLTENLYLVVSGTSDFRPETHYPISLVRISLGFLIAMTVGIVLGIFMGTRRAAKQLFTIPVLTLLTVPAVVWTFICISWFGLTRVLVPVIVISLIVVPFVTINVWKGMEDIDHHLIEMSRVFGAGQFQVWKDIYIPHLLPYIFSTFRIAFAISWKIVLIAEIFGATSGVGYVVNYYYSNLSADMIIAWALPIMFLIFLIDRGLHRVEDRAFKYRSQLDIDPQSAAGG